MQRRGSDGSVANCVEPEKPQRRDGQELVLAEAHRDEGTHRESRSQGETRGPPGPRPRAGRQDRLVRPHHLHELPEPEARGAMCLVHGRLPPVSQVDRGGHQPRRLRLRLGHALSPAVQQRRSRHLHQSLVPRGPGNLHREERLPGPAHRQLYGLGDCVEHGKAVPRETVVRPMVARISVSLSWTPTSGQGWARGRRGLASA
mmetsp:Transcript_171895/g.550932  ORF Transcript_171895/g.550932 Transcript_171895/m.550932 type:complete len:202 (+) Transcript_171895:189-794(+)